MCENCQRDSEAGSRELGVKYHTLCSYHRAKAVGKYQLVQPANSKADNDYSGVK